MAEIGALVPSAVRQNLPGGRMGRDAAGRQCRVGAEERAGEMTVINGLGPAAPISGTAARQGRAAGGFSVPTAVRGGRTVAAEEAPAVLLAGLLALQAEDSGEARDREARRHGHDLLAELAALQRALLADGADGGVPVEQLRRLAGLAATVPAAADARLREVMEAITLRARVELARFGL